MGASAAQMTIPTWILQFESFLNFSFVMINLPRS